MPLGSPNLPLGRCSLDTSLGGVVVSQILLHSGMLAGLKRVDGPGGRQAILAAGLAGGSEPGEPNRQRQPGLRGRRQGRPGVWEVRVPQGAVEFGGRPCSPAGDSGGSAKYIRRVPGESLVAYIELYKLR